MLEKWGGDETVKYELYSSVRGDGGALLLSRVTCAWVN